MIKNIFIQSTPKPFAFYKIAEARGLSNAKINKQRLNRLAAGAEGESIFRRYVEEFGGQDWVVLENVWLDFYGVFECDFLVWTGSRLLVAEVKHFRGLFVYEDGVCHLSGQRISSNCVQQARRAWLNVRSIFEELNVAVEVVGLLAFVGVDNQVEIRSEVADLEIVQRTQIMDFMRRWALEERRQSRVFDTDEMIGHLSKYRAKNPFMPAPISAEDMDNARTGVCCRECGGYALLMKKYRVICRSCGFDEDKRSAVLRTICEYGVLNYEKDLRTGALLKFIGGQVSRDYLVGLLKENFEMLYSGSQTCYVNKKLPYSEIFEDK